MTSLILTVSVLIIAYFLQRGNPVLAGLVAVIPVKIIGVALISYETSTAHLTQAIKGMLIGQFAWGFVLLIVYWVLES